MKVKHILFSNGLKNNDVFAIIEIAEGEAKPTNPEFTKPAITSMVYDVLGEIQESK